MAKILVLIVLILHCSYTTVQGGFPGVFCPGPNGAFLADCSRDCVNSHNAINGRCGVNYNCYCGLPKTTVNKNSTQCRDENEPKWQLICNVDCQCDHGALAGVCNFKTMGCNCVGSVYGYNRNFCPFTNPRQIIQLFNESYHALGFANFADNLLSGKFGKNAQLILQN